MSLKKELEVKVNVHDVEFFSELESIIAKQYLKVEERYQHDRYYSPKDNDYMAEKYPYKWFRLRYLDDGNAEICFKHFYPEGEKNHLYCDEYQSKIEDADAVLKIFDELELQLVAEVNKKRTSYLYGRYIISFDIVNDLGNYIEIEVQDIVFDEMKERIMLNSILRELKLSKYPIELRGYPYLSYYKLRNSNQ